MRRTCRFVVVAFLFSFVAGFSNAAVSPAQLKLLVPAGYLPQVPMLVRVEALNAMGGRERGLWDGQVSLSVDQPGVSLSTNLVTLRNGMGSVLVLVGGSGEFTLTAALGSLTASRLIADRSAEPVTEVGGTLPGEATTWSGVVLVTEDVAVPADHTLTIQSNTLVMINGVSSGSTANDLLISGSIQSLGTESHPVAITCAQPNRRWGQIRHSNAQASEYHHTTITMAGRAPGEGHTGQAPVIRPTNSRILFDGCSITDAASPAGTPGKIMQSAGSDIVMTNCLLSRARMGPEISSTALQFLDSYIIDMRGPDDADGIYLHNQQAGQVIILRGSVVAGGDDDGIDTLGADITVEDCIVRGWNFPGDDSKGISVFGGQCDLWNCLLADNTIGLSGKAGNNASLRVRIDRSTIVGNSFGVAVTNKSGTTPVVDYRITNSIILGPDPVYTDYDPADIHIDYSTIGEAWPGNGNLTSDPLFVDLAASDFRLRPYSPAIDAGDPSAPANPDGSPVDQGYFTFIPPAPLLSDVRLAGNGSCQFLLLAYTNRSYVIDASMDARTWSFLKAVSQPAETNLVTDPSAAGVNHRFYRARLAP